MTYHVIYVPGLGDHRTYNQDKGIRLWRLFGLETHYLPLGWANKEGFDAKLDRLLKEIDRLQSQGHKVALVGVSAGASAVLAAYARRDDLAGTVCICGKIQNPQTIGDHTYQKNPDFKQAMATVKDSLDQLGKKGLLSRILSMHAIRDRTVPPADSRIKGTSSKVLPGWSHVSGIFWGVLLGGPLIASFLRKTDR